VRASLLPLLMVLVGPSSASQAGTPGPTAIQPLVAGIVAAGLSEYHYSERPLDDAMSSCWLEGYLDQLDPDRSVFTQADVAGFRAWDTRLDDAMRAMPPNVSPAWTIQARYQQRWGERVAWTRQALQTAPDLSDDETIEIDRSKLAWPADETALRDVWRRELEEDWLGQQLAGTSQEDIVKRLGQRLERLDQALSETEAPDILEGWLDALTECYDPHTLYMKPVSADDFAISTSGSLEGIGAKLGVDGDTVVVNEVLPGGPAARSGELKSGDKIVGVAQGMDEWVDVVGMRLEKVVQLIRGPKGTVVRLQLAPVGAVDPSERKVVEMERDRIDLESVVPTLTMHDSLRPDGSKGKVAVLVVPAFVGEAHDAEGGTRPSTTQQVRDLLVQAKGADAVIMDLRENGGGVLDEAVGLAGLFLDKGPVVQIRDGKGRVEQLDDKDKGRAWSGPLVVLTSPYSASASEIVAGALQDYGRALIVGSDTTYGKGSVQTVVPLDPILDAFAPDQKGKEVAGVLKITFSQYYLPGGRSTQAEGVPADVILPSPYEGRILREKDHPHALPADRIAAAGFAPEGDVSKLRDTLRARSAARIAKDTRFQAMAVWQKYMAGIEARKTLSLKLSTRQADLAERKIKANALRAALGLPAEEDADTSAAAEGAESSLPQVAPASGDPASKAKKPAAPPPDPELDEAVNVAADLAGLSKA